MTRAKTAVATLCALAAIGPAKAEPIRLRASDIAQGSRVEIPIHGAGFGVERTGPRQIDIVIDAAGAAFDVSEIFPGAAARRIVTARTVPDESGTRLRFILNCDCDFAARVTGDVLSVEFRDPPSGEAKPESADRVASAGAPAEALPRRAPGEGTKHAPLRAPAPKPRGSDGEVAAAEAPAAGDEQASKNVVIARQKLLEQLSRAAEQGLLDFRSPEAAAMAPPPQDRSFPIKAKPPEVEEPVETAAKEEERAPEPEPEAPALNPPPPPPAVELPVRARTAIDRDFREDRAETFAQTATCIEESRLDTYDWPDPQRFSEELSATMRGLLDQFDTPVPDAATRLARLYVIAGFGEEAIETIGIFGDAVEDGALLRDLAHVVDGERPPADGPLSLGLSCSGRVAMWRRAAGMPPAVIPPGDPAVIAAVNDEMIAAFTATPVALRILLGPMIVGTLLDQNDPETARKVDLILRRIPGDHGPAFDLARARLLTVLNEDEEAEALFARLGRRDLAESREALLRLLENRIGRGAPIGADLTEALAEAAFIARGSPMERSLKVAEIRARVRSEGLAAALDTVRNAMDRSPASAIILRDAAHAALEEAQAVTEGPLAYTRAVLAHRDEISADIAGDAARRQIAEQLTGLGLANAALAFLEPALGRGAPDVRRAAARAMLSEDDATGALAALNGLAGIEAARLRARAEQMMDNPAEALATLEEADAPEAGADLLAFKAGAWAEAATMGPEELRLLAAYMAGPDSAPARETLKQTGDPAAAAFLDPPRVSDEVTLGDAQSVMDASRAVRAVIEEALNDG